MIGEDDMTETLEAQQEQGKKLRYGSHCHGRSEPLIKFLGRKRTGIALLKGFLRRQWSVSAAYNPG